ncbi:MAG TPA: alpha/beta fold hydrolase [Pseudolysinimonas sp.]|nr:alpha/beta fold hydrolase [Pseudolysinimonas sp.]
MHVTSLPADGEPAGPTVVLLHGFASTGERDFPAERWAEPLHAAGRDVRVIDLPGHGASPAEAIGTRATIAALTDAVAGARGGIDLVGYSLGARLAWDLASAVPVQHLVLGGLSPMEPFAAVDFAAARRFASDGTEPADPLTGFIARMVTAPGNDADALLRVAEGLGREPFTLADPPAVPTLVVAGSDDPMAAGGEPVAAAIPGATLLVVPGDHLAALASDEFRAGVLTFLGA